MRRLLFVQETGISPRQCLASTAFMMEAVGKGRTQGAPFLKLSLPEGEAVVLGRYQKAGSAVRRDVCKSRNLTLLRRLTGGTTALLGKDRLHLSLVLPDRASPLECEPRQFLQRYGAGLIRGLVQAGLKARYFGKDLVSVEDRPLGLMSFEIAPDGTALLEAIVGLRQPWWPDTELSGYPPRSKDDSAVAAPTLIGDELTELNDDRLIAGLQEAVVDLLDLEVERREFSALEAERIKSLSHRVEVPEDPAEPTPQYLKPWSSRPIEEAIGFVEATVRLTQGRFLRDVGIHGDFMADSGGMDELQDRLKMVPVKRRPVALVIDDVLGAPEHVIMGIRRLGSILEAILDASKQGSEESGKA
ncbi:MAG: hypothetical protein ABI333_29420 [bacterium]